MRKEDIPLLQKEVAGKQAADIVRWALGRFDPAAVAFSSSFGAEDQVIADLLAAAGGNAHIFTLDTGRLPAETIAVLAATEKRCGIPIEILRPDAEAVKQMEQRYGPNLFYESVEKRALCCRIRKVEPLKRKLATLEAWICGLRKEQSITRRQVAAVEWDDTFGLIKINPLADWTQQDVWAYIKEHRVPYNALHDKGYPSIGCDPCTKAVKPGEDIRSGRWWWETAARRECGLHAGGEKQQKGRSQ